MKKLANLSLIFALVCMLTRCDTIINRLWGNDSSDGSKTLVVLYVAPISSGFGDGSSWANASGDLQAMINIAANPQNGVSSIWVKEGTYTPTQIPATGTTTPRDRTFFLREGVKIYGGFAGTETSFSQRAIAGNTTTLSGDFNGNDSGTVSTSNSTMSENAYHVVIGMHLTNATVLDGFTISGGNGNGGFADYIYIDGTAVERSYGGGIFNRDASPTFANVTISGNCVGRYGGGIYNFLNSSPTFTNVVISGNVATTQGGGIYNYTDSSPVLTNVVISGNVATTQGGGIYNVNASSPILTNVTISGNYAQTGGGGMDNNTRSNSQIRNSIIWGNGSTSTTPNISKSADSTPTFANSLVQGAIAVNWVGFGDDQGGNIDVNPSFISPITASSTPTTSGNYQLNPGAAATAGMGSNYFGN